MNARTRLAAAVLAGAAAVVALPAPAWSYTAPSYTAPKRPHPHRKPWPVTITVQTVPALANVHLTVDGKTLTTDGNGRAAYTAEHNFAQHTLTLTDTSIDTPQQRYRFARWAGQRDPNQAYRATVTGLPMRANYTVTAAFTVQYPVTARLVDENGAPLDLTRVSGLTLKADDGQLLPLPTTGAVWLDGITPQYRKSALIESPVYYSVQTLTMGGANIVDSGKQRFTPSKGTTVTVTGQLHDLSIDAKDAMYGGAVGDRAVVTGPDGTVRTVAFGPAHAVTLHNLPRGQYHVTVRGAGGIVLDEQFGLSRDKQLSVEVLSTADLATLGAAGLLLAALLLLLGRRALRRPFVRVVSGAVRFLRPPLREEVPAA